MVVFRTEQCCFMNNDVQSALHISGNLSGSSDSRGSHGAHAICGTNDVQPVPIPPLSPTPPCNASTVPPATRLLIPSATPKDGPSATPTARAPRTPTATVKVTPSPFNYLRRIQGRKPRSSFHAIEESILNLKRIIIHHISMSLMCRKSLARRTKPLIVVTPHLWCTFWAVNLTH
jgi:hypothetical protein